MSKPKPEPLRLDEVKPGSPMKATLTSFEYREALASVAMSHPEGCGCQVCTLVRELREQ